MPFQFRKEAIEEDLNSNFPSQGQGNPPLYYSLSEVVVPTYSINSVTEGSGLPEILQTAWDFSTGSAQVFNTTSTLISNTGFWLVDLNCTVADIDIGSPVVTARAYIDDGLTEKNVWGVSRSTSTVNNGAVVTENRFVVFLRSGDEFKVFTNGADTVVDVWYRQIATVNGQLVNPLGFSFA